MSSPIRPASPKRRRFEIEQDEYSNNNDNNNNIDDDDDNVAPMARRLRRCKSAVFARSNCCDHRHRRTDVLKRVATNAVVKTKCASVKKEKELRSPIYEPLVPPRDRALHQMGLLQRLNADLMKEITKLKNENDELKQQLTLAHEIHSGPVLQRERCRPPTSLYFSCPPSTSSSLNNVASNGLPPVDPEFEALRNIDHLKSLSVRAHSKAYMERRKLKYVVRRLLAFERLIQNECKFGRADVWGNLYESAELVTNNQLRQHVHDTETFMDNFTKLLIARLADGDAPLSSSSTFNN